MKVAYILHDTDAQGGAYKSFLPMLYALMKKGVEPLVVVPNNKGLKSDLDTKGIPTLVLNYRLNTYPYEESVMDYLLWLPRLIARRCVNAMAARRLADHIKGYDIIHSNSSVIDIGARAGKLSSIPHVFHFRENPDLIGMRYYPCKKSFYNMVTHAICITKDVQKHHSLTGRSEVIYDCIMGDDKTTENKTQKTYLLFAGRLEYNKGIEELIEAYAASTRSLPLLVAGAPLEGSYLNKLKHKAEAYGIADKVRFLGVRNDVPELMAGARATIVPSYNEGFGRILPEAMFMKCITIGRNTSGTKEQFDNGLQITGDEIGLRFNTKEELTTLLNIVSGSKQEDWDDYRERARRTVNMLYTPKACSDAVMKLYNRILKHDEQP